MGETERIFVVARNYQLSKNRRTGEPGLFDSISRDFQSVSWMCHLKIMFENRTKRL